MNEKQGQPLIDAAEDQLLAELVEEYTSRLQAGEQMHYSEFASKHPEHAECLRRLLPTLHVLADAGGPSVDATGALAEAASTSGPLDGLLGDYRLIREIGRGGMGVVYEAQQISLERRVAVKVLPFAALLDPRQLQRFHNEARAAACLHHEHIVPVFAVGCERGVHYYVMQFIDGQSLDQCLWGFQPDAPGPMNETCPSANGASTAPERMRATIPDTSVRIPVRGIVRLALQAANALEHAHQQGIVHRDIKPANLLVNRDGDHLWITDFGLARCQGETNLTRTGDLLGTLRYMSPEQALAKPGLVDQRTDIYALGASLYELLTAQPVFPGQSRQELLRQIADQEPVPLRTRESSVPLELETIVLKALAKNPVDRYTTAQELADDLQRFLEDRPVRARRPTAAEKVVRWSRRHKGVVAASLAGAFALLITLAASTLVIGRQLIKERSLKETARRVVDDFYLGFVQDWLSQKPELEAEQRDLLLKALHSYEDFARESGQDPRVRLGVARAWHCVADIQAKLGDRTAARNGYERAVAVLEDLDRRQPRQSETLNALAGCWNDLGNVYRDENNTAQAESAYRNARVLFARQANALPEDKAAWSGLAGCSMNLGAVLGGRSRTQEAESLLCESIDIDRHWLASSNGTPGWRHDLAVALGNLAELKGNQGHGNEAAAVYRESLTFWAGLVTEFPDRMNYRQAAVRAHCSLAALLAGTGDLKSAEAQYREAIAGAESMMTDHPRVCDYARTLASARNRLARVLWDRDQSAAAETLLRQAVEQLTSFARSAPDKPEVTIELAACESDLAEMLENKKDAASAEGLYRQAAKRLETLADPHAHVAEAAWLRGHIAICLANLLFESGRRREASENYAGAISIKDRLAASRPEVAGYQADLAATLLDCRDQSRRNPRRAVELAQRATELAPLDASAWFILGSAQYRDGQWPEALIALEKARELEKMEYPATWLLLALCYQKLGERSKACHAWSRSEVSRARHIGPERAFSELREEARKAFSHQSCSPADHADPKTRPQG